jgi:hypothetical protein
VAALGLLPLLQPERHASCPSFPLSHEAAAGPTYTGSRYGSAGRPRIDLVSGGGIDLRGSIDRWETCCTDSVSMLPPGRSPRHFNRRLACSLTPLTNSSGAIVAFMSTRYSSSSITSRTVHSRPSRSSSNAIGCSRRCLAGSVCSTYCGNQAVSRAFRRSFMPFPPFSNRAVLLQPFLDSLHGSHASISTCISDIFSTFKSRSR